MGGQLLWRNSPFIHLGSEKIAFRRKDKWAAMSATSKAFELYMRKNTDDDLRSVYRQSAKVIFVDKTDKELTTVKTI